MEVTKLSIKKSFLMNSIDFESLIITIFVLVDDWYQVEGKALKPLSSGAKPEMSDSPKGYRFAYEIMTLALVMDYLPFPGETQFISFVRANYGQWFPNLLSQSQRLLRRPKGHRSAYETTPALTFGQFNRRLRRLGQMLET